MHQILVLRVALTLKTLPFIVLEVSNNDFGTTCICIAIVLVCVVCDFIVKHIISPVAAQLYWCIYILFNLW